jgi:hypothetical protein
MKFSEFVHETIRLERAIPWQDYPNHVYGFLFGKFYRRYTLPADLPLIPERERLRAFLRGQPPAFLYALVALHELGQGENAMDRLDFLEWYAAASDRCPTLDDAVAEVLTKTMLAEDLLWGLELVSDAAIDMDQLLSVPQ